MSCEQLLERLVEVGATGGGSGKGGGGGEEVHQAGRANGGCRLINRATIVAIAAAIAG